MRTIAVCLLFLAAFAARAQDLGKPMLLVATPAMKGPYSRTVLVAVPHAEGHFGFVLNLPSDTHLAKAFPDHAPSAKVVDPICIGGPDMAQRIFALRRGDPGQPSIRLFGDLFATSNARLVDDIIERTPNEARYFAGAVRWRANELARELAAGWWYVGEAEEAQVLRRDVDGLWSELVKRFGKGDAPERKAPLIPGLRMQET